MHTDRIFGRDAELARFAAAVRDAVEGRGSVWLVTGEPGVGKTRLVEEFERTARDAGFVCAWGRCSEAGDAPAFWPWTQALRSLRRVADANRVGPGAGSAIDALAHLDGAAVEGSRPASRFELFEAVAGWLCDVAAIRPVWIALDDVHAADAPSLVLAEALSASLRTGRVVVVATARDEATARGPVAEEFDRVVRLARVVPLRRLDDGAARALARAALDRTDGPVVDAAVQATSGLPLFLVELGRLVAQSPSTAPPDALVSANLQKVLRAQVDRLDAATRAGLSRAAVAGVEFDADLTAIAFDFEGLGATLARAAGRGLVTEIVPGRWRFNHALLRDLLLGMLSADQRTEAHARLADALRATGSAAPAQLAHHLHAAGGERLGSAVATDLEAARDAVERFAFEAAHPHLDRAIAHASASAEPARTRARASLLRGLAQIGSGRVSDGLAACIDAFRAAKAATMSDLMADAALGYGSILRYANVDPVLVGMLEEALEALPAGDSPLRARVMARLAAARQPDLDSARPIALALEAIAMADRVGDLETRIATLASGCSALVDLAHPRRRFELDRRQLELASAASRHAEALQARIRLAFDCAELGDYDAAVGHVREARALSGANVHPRDRWRAPALDALLDLWDGPTAETAGRIELALREGVELGDSNARSSATFQRARLAVLTGDRTHLPEILDGLRAAFPSEQIGAQYFGVLASRLFLQLGDTERGIAALDREDAFAILPYSDRTVYFGLAMWAAAAGDTELGRVLVHTLRDDVELFVTDGVLSLCWVAPMALVLALATEATGDVMAAAELASRAARNADRAGGRPAAAEAHAHAARLARAAGLDESAGLHEREALVLIEAQGLNGFRHLLDPRHARKSPPTRVPGAGAAPKHPEFIDEGDMWRVSFAGRTARVRKTKGLSVIADLVARPGRPVPVLEIVHPDGASRELDRGDAGPALDAAARAAYRARAAELRDALAEAEEHNDLGRIERARSELEFLAQELARATGLGGRVRGGPDAGERARQAVQKQIRTALERLEPLMPELHHHLVRSIRTGRACMYDP